MRRFVQNIQFEIATTAGKTVWAQIGVASVRREPIDPWWFPRYGRTDAAQFTKGTRKSSHTTEKLSAATSKVSWVRFALFFFLFYFIYSYKNIGIMASNSYRILPSFFSVQFFVLFSISYDLREFYLNKAYIMIL